MQCFCVCYQTKGYAMFVCVLSDKGLCNICVCVIRQTAMHCFCLLSDKRLFKLFVLSLDKRLCIFIFCYQTKGYIMFCLLSDKKLCNICLCYQTKAFAMVLFLLSDRRLYNVVFCVIRQKVRVWFCNICVVRHHLRCKGVVLYNLRC